MSALDRRDSEDGSIRMRWLNAPLIAAMLVACATNKTDLYKERDVVEQQICTRTSLAETTAALDARGFEYHVDPGGEGLRGIKLYNEQQGYLTRSYIAVDVTFSDFASKPSTCVVRVGFAGP